MSSNKPAKKTRSTKTKADLEAKIAELEAKLNTLAAQAKPTESKPTSTSPPKPQVQERAPQPEAQQKQTLPKTESQQKPQVSKETIQTSVSSEVAPSYSTTSSSGYTGNRYYATRHRLAYHPPDKQFTGQVTVQVAREAPPAPAPEPEPIVEQEPQKPNEEPRQIEPPTPRVKFTGDNYYRTRKRMAYHPADKQFAETVAIKFDEAPSVSQVEFSSSQQSSSSSSQKKSRAEELEAYEREYLERLRQQREEAEKPQPAPSETRPHGTMPAGWKPT